MCVYINVCICVCVYISVCIYMCICVCVYMCICVYIYICVCIYVYIHACMCIYTHRHTHIAPLFWISFPFRLPQSIKESSLCYSVGYHQLFISYIVLYIYVNRNLPTYPIPPFPLSVQMFVLYVCVSILAMKVGSSLPFF